MTDQEYEQLGIRLREVRTQRGYSIQALADHISVAKNTVRNIELGRTKPSLDLLVQLVCALDVSMDYIVLGIRPRASSLGLILHCPDDPASEPAPDSPDR